MLLAASQLSLLPNWTFVVELVIFLVVFGLLAKFVLPPVHQALKEREATVRGSLRAGDEGRAEADRLAAEREAVLAGARGEARRLLDEARQRVEEHRSRAREQAEAERARILAEAAETIEAERPAVRAEAMRDVERLVLLAAEQVLGRPVEAGRHRELVEAALAATSGSTSPLLGTGGPGPTGGSPLGGGS